MTASSGLESTSLDLVEAWLKTRLFARVLGHTVNLDSIDADDLLRLIKPAAFPLCLVTAYNPMAAHRSAEINRQANRALRAQLDEQGRCWFPAVGRAADGSWSEPGFIFPVSSEDEAAKLGATYGQLAVFVLYADAVVVRHSFTSIRHSRRRENSHIAAQKV